MSDRYPFLKNRNWDLMIEGTRSHLFLLFLIIELQASENIPEREQTRTSSILTDTNNNTSRKPSITEQLVILTTSALVLPPSSPTVPRDLWTNKVEFLLSVIGYVVDLGNVWRFPYVCYANGGGAFLIPYMIFLCLIGIPMMYLELFLGQFYRCGNITLWGRIAPSMKGIGIASFLIVTAVTLFYTTIIAHAVFYLFSSFREVLPWSLCSHTWNTPSCSERMRIDSVKNQTNEHINFNGINNFFSLNETQKYNSIIDSKVSSADEYYNIYMLGINHSKGLTDLGSIKIDLLLCLISIFVLMYMCIYRGVKSTGKAVYVTATLPYIVLIILLIQGLNLEGSRNGITYFLKPSFSKLKDMKVWYSAANQIFFTLGPGLSVLTTYGSYNVSSNNCYYDALIAVVANFAASFLSGFVVFSALGHMSWRLQKNVESVVDQGPSLSFIAYPEILATFKYPALFSILFFLMVINLGLDSDFGGLESMYTALSDEFPLLKRHRKSGMFIMCFVLIIACLPTVTQGGNYVIYGINNLVNDIRTNLGFEPNLFFRLAWTVICPVIVIMLMVLALSYSDELKYGNYIFPSWSIIFGWCLNMCFILPIPIVMLYAFFRHTDSRNSFKQRINDLFTPNITKQRMKQQIEKGTAFTMSSSAPISHV
ncbi:unnamed protein product [Rotaria magnacalcarata]|uniref:Transporter n=1 Tax=Rotaria magnacalcarata TaxID=392030 RepID=A0A8S2KKE0_9BILA|nr:unnamed protein product [Rotaria magnacalcarata]